jgi:hypothetical protein
MNANLSGHWVDIAHFESSVIDENVVWPIELYFHERGAGVSNEHWMGTFAPLRRGEPSCHSVSVREIEDGYAELTITDSCRIVVKMREHVDELTYYIEDVPHRMIRRTEHTHRRRFYQVEPAESGGIRLLYLLGHTLMPGEGFTIYRSQVPGQLGIPVYIQERVAHHHNVEFIDPWRYNNRVLFEFIDTDVSYGVYYYSFSTNSWSRDNVIEHDGEPWQIRVDVGALLQQEDSETDEAMAENEMPNTYDTEESSGRPYVIVLLFAFVVVIVGFYLHGRVPHSGKPGYSSL